MKKKLDPKTLKLAYASIFNKSEMGKIVMKDLQTWCHINDTSFNPNNSNITAFNEGKRFIYLRICKMAKINLDKIMVSGSRATNV